MRNTRSMEWTCPKCRTRNSRPIPGNTPEGKLVAVRCESSGAAYYATAIVREQRNAPPAVYGVTWV
jgi:hypothetical protein